jgi:hypothetical protein
MRRTDQVLLEVRVGTPILAHRQFCCISDTRRFSGYSAGRRPRGTCEILRRVVRQ